ncbi:MAG: translation initiation factor 6 [Colwellia polaris]|jgi:translation initiation factor 6
MIEKYNYEGNTTVGLYGVATNEYAVVAPEFTKKDLFEVETVVETYITQTRLVGMFTAGNSNCLLLPENVGSREKEALEEAGIPFKVIEAKGNALGNLVLANDKGAVISPKLEEQREIIEEALEVEVKVMEIAGIPNPGVCGRANSRGVLLHRAASEEDAEKAKEVLEVENVDIGTVNMGSPFIGSGLICNDNLMLTGEDSTGPEIGRIDTTLNQ